MYIFFDFFNEYVYINELKGKIHIFFLQNVTWIVDKYIYFYGQEPWHILLNTKSK